MRTAFLPRDVRSRLLVIVVATLAIALAAATYGFNALLAHTTARDVDSVLRERADSERAVIQIANGRIRLSETTDDTVADSRIWIYQGAHALEAPHSSRRTAAAVRSLAGGPTRYLDLPTSDERLYALPVNGSDRGRIGTIIVGVSVAPYEQTQHAALTGSLVLALTLLGLVGVAVWWLLRSALRPVAEMTEQAAAWSERDLDHRFEIGEPHDELTRLATTLNGLLDRLAASLRHERRFSAEVSHELRTPLSKVIAEAELTLRRDRGPSEYREAFEVVLRNARQIARIIETLVAAARHDASTTRGTADAYDVARQVVESVAHLSAERGIGLHTERPAQPLRIGVDADLAERVLQPVVENACRYGRSQVTVTLERLGSRVAYVVSDDGLGIQESEQEAIFEPGVRGRLTNGAPGAGLGLALARRLARAAAGDITVSSSAAGSSFSISLPAA